MMMMFADDEDGDLLGHWPWRIHSVKTVRVKAGEVKHLPVVKVRVQVVHRYLKLMMVTVTVTVMIMIPGGT